MLSLKEAVMWGLLVTTGLGLSYAKGHADATDSMTITQQADQLAAVKKLEEQRDGFQKALNEQSNAWQAHLAKSQELADRTVADLRSRGIRLSVELADARVCAVTGSCGPVPNGRAELSDNTSGFLIKQAQRCDAQVKGLQETIRILQGGSK